MLRRHPSWRSGRVVATAAIIAAALVSAGVGGSQAVAASSASTTAHVSATTGWQDSGVALQSGEKYTVSYVSGTCTTAADLTS
jgi:hypothetical protein